MPLRLATWNVNSVRLRLEQLAWIDQRLRPDVLCLQETKVVDSLFPREALAELGFTHLALWGMKGYNGVAIAARHPLQAVRTQSWCGRDDCRHLIATVEGVDIHCLYIPSGGDVPDPDVNDKFAHKLAFLDEVAAWFAETADPAKPMALLGDFNIAPLETDVWSHRQMLKVVSHTPVEVERLAVLRASLGWVDAVRQVIPPEEHLYTWWSYRAADWAKADRGRRLDHVWVTPALAPRVTDALILKETRGWQPPSDHVPVLVELG
jgi:exodeoxyribonuclease-3